MEGLIFGILRYDSDRKGTQLFYIPSFDKIWYPLHTYSLEPCMIPFYYIDTDEIPGRYYFYLSCVRILGSPWLLT